MQLYIVKRKTLIYTYTGIRLHPTTGNGGHSKLWYVEHMRPVQLMNIYEMSRNIFELRLMKSTIIHTGSFLKCLKKLKPTGSST